MPKISAFVNIMTDAQKVAKRSKQLRRIDSKLLKTNKNIELTRYLGNEIKLRNLLDKRFNLIYRKQKLSLKQPVLAIASGERIALPAHSKIADNGIKMLKVLKKLKATMLLGNDLAAAKYKLALEKLAAQRSKI